MNTSYKNIDCFCNKSEFETCFVYNARPKGETNFEFSSLQKYYREIKECKNCGHFISHHNMNIEKLYKEDYVTSTYGMDGILKNFNKINSLPSEKSDNIARVKRILDFSTNHYKFHVNKNNPLKLLDVGMGLGVFPFRMKEVGWECTGLDSDLRQVEHAKNVIGINAILGDFLESSINDSYDVITFNKVLEHIKNPLEILKKCHSILSKNGFIYVEVPDGELASKDSFNREEFFIDHHHIFSMLSLCFLIKKSGFIISQMERLIEPSSKYTLRVFLKSEKS